MRCWPCSASAGSCFRRSRPIWQSFLLFIVGGGMRSGLAILYLFPLAGAAILAPLMLSLFCAALVACSCWAKASGAY
jgi:hypothetical protein